MSIWFLYNTLDLQSCGFCITHPVFPSPLVHSALDALRPLTQHKGPSARAIPEYHQETKASNRVYYPFGGCTNGTFINPFPVPISPNPR